MNSLNFIKENYKFCSIKMTQNKNNLDMNNNEINFYFEDKSQTRLNNIGINNNNDQKQSFNSVQQFEENNNSYSLISDEEEKENISISNFEIFIYALPSFGKMSCAVMLK